MKTAAKVSHLPARDHLRALGLGSAHHLRHLVQAGPVDQRSHVQVLLRRWVAIACGGHRLGHLIDEPIGHLARHINTLCAVAHLPGVDHPRGDDRVDCQVQVGIGQHDGRRLAAQLQVQLGDVRRRRCHDPRTGRHAAGETDHVHARVTGQAVAHGGACAADHVEHPGWQAGLGHQAGERVAVDRGFLTRLDHNGVAGNERRRHLAGDQEKGEVPRQDACHHAHGLAHEKHVFGLTVAGQHLAFQASRPFSHVVQVIGREADFHLGQGRHLAAFQGDGPGQLIGIGPYPVRDGAQVACAFLRRPGCPGALSPACRAHGLVDLGLRRLRHATEQLAIGRVMNLEQGLTGFEPVVDEVLVDRIVHGHFTPVGHCQPAMKGLPDGR